MITIVMGIGIFAIGANAYLNTNTVAMASSPNDTATTNVSDTSAVQDAQQAAAAAQLKQMQDLVKQYQGREKQYQQELNDAAQRLKDQSANLQSYQEQVQTYQNIFMQLQQAGVIRVDANGRISIPRGR